MIQGKCIDRTVARVLPFIQKPTTCCAVVTQLTKEAIRIESPHGLLTVTGVLAALPLRIGDSVSVFHNYRFAIVFAHEQVTDACRIWRKNDNYFISLRGHNAHFQVGNANIFMIKGSNMRVINDGDDEPLLDVAVRLLGLTWEPQRVTRVLFKYY